MKSGPCLEEGAANSGYLSVTFRQGAGAPMRLTMSINTAVNRNAIELFVGEHADMGAMPHLFPRGLDNAYISTTSHL
jgi:hypothetical protein